MGKPPLFTRKNRSGACMNERHDHCLAWGCACPCHCPEDHPHLAQKEEST